MLPWLLTVGMLAAYLAFLLRKHYLLKQAMIDSHSTITDRDHQVTLLTERLASAEADKEHHQQENASRITFLTAERSQLQGEIKELYTQNSRLQADMAAMTTKVQRLAPLSNELHDCQSKLDTLRQEKSSSDAALAALTSRQDEERKAYEEQIRLRAKAETETLEASKLRISELAEERDGSRRQRDQLRAENSQISTEHAALQTKIEEERKAAEDKIRLLEQAEGNLTKEFENLANRIFEEKHQKFSEVSKNNIESILSPVRQQLSEFRKKVDDVYDKENKERASLRTEIQQLKSLNERIGTDALNLTKALKGDAKLRGNWGEMQLERLLEESGLSKGREYEVQASLKDEEGKRLQPDVVIHLPENKDVIIDSKVSLVAYEQYHAAESDDERRNQLRSHLQSLRTHFTGLSAKNYDELVGVNSLDLVIMFVPIEPALLLAFEHEPGLFSEAFNRRILLVSPSTLMATLQIINNIWRYEYQNRNALQIATDAGRLHDQFVLFVEALEDVGVKLQKASDSYQTAHKRLTSGRGNLVGRTLKLEKLGAKTKKKIDKLLLEEALLQESLPEKGTEEES